MCRLHLSDPDRAFQYRLREETIEQHDTPQQPMTAHIRKRGGSTYHQAKDNLKSSKYQVIDKIVNSARKKQQGTERLQRFVIRLPLTSLLAAE